VANVETQFQGVLVDGLHTTGSVTSYLSIPDSHGIADLIAGCQVWGEAVDGVTDGAFTELNVQLIVPLPGELKAPTGATWEASRIEQTGVISFSATGSDRRWGFAIPSLSSSVLSRGTIDMANAAIVALIDLLLNPTDLFTNSQQQVLEAALDALLSFRKRTQLRKRSLVIQ
jgi:hypothetical protein